MAHPRDRCPDSAKYPLRPPHRATVPPVAITSPATASFPAAAPGFPAAAPGQVNEALFYVDCAMTIQRLYCLFVMEAGNADNSADRAIYGTYRCLALA